MSRALSGVLVGSHPYIKAGDTLQRLPRAKTPIGAWIAALIADIDSGAVAPCPHHARTVAAGAAVAATSG